MRTLFDYTALAIIGVPTIGVVISLALEAIRSKVAQ